MQESPLGTTVIILASSVRKVTLHPRGRRRVLALIVYLRRPISMSAKKNLLIYCTQTELFHFCRRESSSSLFWCLSWNATGSHCTYSSFPNVIMTFYVLAYASTGLNMCHCMSAGSYIKHGRTYRGEWHCKYLLEFQLILCLLISQTWVTWDCITHTSWRD